MTDNEKRAHDLAIAVCSDICRMKTNTQIANVEGDIGVDYFREYMNAYNVAIKSFNREFPDGK